MRRVRNLLTAVVCAAALSVSSHSWAGCSADLSQIAAHAISDDPALAEASINSLRAAGPEGLQAMLDAYRPLVERAIADPPTTASDPQWQKVHAAIDAVAGQRDAHVSKLYWYTSIELAKSVAREENKPILSLRLLGKLTDELSCANSRFFRTVLYANEDVSRVLRDRFILHWESVRPVPKVTIDFGDGRTLVRTVTGNSIHYVLDSQGRPVDALPGLYGPQAFLRGLDQAAELVTKLDRVDAGFRGVELANCHRQKLAEVAAQWKKDMAELGISPGEPNEAASSSERRIAFVANERTVAKRQAEEPLVAAALADCDALLAATDDDVWGRIAQLHASDATLDPASVAFIRAKTPIAITAGRLAVSKMRVEDPLLRLVRDFQRTVAIDTVRNEYTFHQKIHQWFAESNFDADSDPSNLNERVYAELFLTPSSDPWLGLVPGDVYTALDNNGICSKPD